MNNEAVTIGDYVVRFCKLKNIRYKTFARACGYRSDKDISTIKQVTMHQYFLMAEYMSRRSRLPEPFYLQRLKDIIKGDYRCRDLSL